MFPKKTILFILIAFSFCKLKSQSVGGATSGGSSFCDTINSGFVSLNSYVGNILFWQSSNNNGTSWSNIPNITPTQSYNNLKNSTSFRAIVKNGSFPTDTSTVSKINIHIPGPKGTMIGGGNFCANSGSGILTITGVNGNILEWQTSANNGITWSSITNTTTSQSYTNLTQNTLYMAIVQTVTYCPNDTTPTATFIIDPISVAGSILSSDTVCNGTPGDTLTLIGNVGSVIDWQKSNNNGLTWASYGNNSINCVYPTVTQTIWYRAIVKSGVCTQDTTATALISVYNITPAYAGEDVTITQYENIPLNGSGNGSPQWSPQSTLDNSEIFNPVATPYHTTTYVLTLTDANACISKDSMTINVIIPIPTAITPNNDGVNDLFVIDKIEQYENNSIKIFNRWGNLVYEEVPYKNTWSGKSQNGKDLADDVYYYTFDFGNGDKPISSYILIKR